VILNKEKVSFEKNCISLFNLSVGERKVLEMDFFCCTVVL
jgi:hypothetical protein